MKLSLSVILAVASSSSFPAVLSWTTSAPPSSRSSLSTSTSTSTRLGISSWGTKGSPFTGGGVAENVNPEDNIQSYLAEPSAVEARSNVDGTILVSGVANAPDRTDQFLFDLLNDEDSAFEFTTIKAFVKDAKFSKKRLISRSARYTGLLDKLDFVQAESALPTAAQLEGVKSWLAVVEDNHLAQVAEIQSIAQQTSLENVAILMVGATELDLSASQAALDAMPHEMNPEITESQDDDAEPVIPPTTFTMVVVGELDEDTPEGRCFYQYKTFGTDDGVIPADAATFPRQESYRLITELLQLACGRQKALSFARVFSTNVTEAKLIKGLREAGYARPQEIDHMIRSGPQKYREFVENWKKDNPDAAKGYTTDAWWEADIYQQSRKKSAERAAAKEQVIVDERTQEIEAIAKEWVKREYFRQSMAGSVPEATTEEEFTQQVWDRALFEADLKYRQIKGEVDIDAEAELADFKARQERKQQTMLTRAKQELAELLDEDPDTLIPPETDDDDDEDSKDE